MAKKRSNTRKVSREDSNSNRSRNGSKGYNRKTNEERTNVRGSSPTDYMGQDNDASWYNNMATLVKDVTAIPFGYQVGRQLPGSSSTLTNTTISLASGYFESGMNKDAIPGVCLLKMHICPGIASSAVDGVNIAAQGLFQNIRRSLSTVATYAAADVMMYVLACDSLLALYSQIVRDFGMINAYSSMNLNYNRTIFRAMYGSDGYAEDLIQFQSQYMQMFNNMVYKASTIYVPDMFPIIRRHVWLTTNYFLDAKDPKSQLYVHALDGVYQLDEKISSQGTALKYVSLDTIQSMGDLLEQFNTLIEQIRNSDSMLKIAADLARAFPSVNAWNMGYLNGTYVSVPTYSEEVLSQIENTTILPKLHEDIITQSVDKNIILFQPTVTLADGQTNEEGWFLYCGNSSDWNSQFLLNMHWTNPSSDDVAVATRNMVVLRPQSTFHIGSETTISLISVDACGADICVGASLVKFDASTGTYSTTRIRRMNVLEERGAPFQNTLSATGLSDYITFDWAPIIYVGDRINITSSADGKIQPGSVGSNYRPLLDAANFTFIDSTLLAQMHNNVIMSMWSIPQLGEIPKP